MTLAVSPADADWYCDGADESCYIKSVKYGHGNETSGLDYAVKAKIVIGDDETDCTSIIYYNDYTSDDGDYIAYMAKLKLMEAIMLTALATGMKIAFDTADPNGGECLITVIEVRKP